MANIGDILRKSKIYIEAVLQQNSCLTLDFQSLKMFTDQKDYLFMLHESQQMHST